MSEYVDLLEKFKGVSSVINEPIKFKIKLGIGEDAFTSLRIGRGVSELWDLGGAAGTGAAVAASPLIANTFFPATGFMAWLGLGTAVTPIGWVIGAGCAAGGAYYMLLKASGSYRNRRVDTVPRFINTPIDILAAALFDLVGTLAVKVGQCDGAFPEIQQQAIKAEFVREWGYSPSYVDAAFGLLLENSDDRNISHIARSLADFKRSNPDCNAKKIADDLMVFLSDMISIDGIIDPREEAAIVEIREMLYSKGKARRLVDRLRTTIRLPNLKRAAS